MPRAAAEPPRDGPQGVGRSPYAEGPQIGSAVQPPRASRTCRAGRGRPGPSAAPLPGRRARPEDVDHGDGAVAQLLVEPAYQRRGEQPQLGRPGGGVGAHHQLALGEGLGRAVVGDLVADQLRPAGEDAAHPQVELPPLGPRPAARPRRPAAGGRGRRGGRRTPGRRVCWSRRCAGACAAAGSAPAVARVSAFGRGRGRRPRARETGASGVSGEVTRSPPRRPRCTSRRPARRGRRPPPPR